MNIGDKIRVKKNYFSVGFAGKEGIIVCKEVNDYGVKFNNYEGGHTLGGRCDVGYGRWFGIHENSLELIKTKPETAREKVMF